MGTTDATTGGVALTGLRDAGVPFAFLHAEARVAAGENVGDYDLLVAARHAGEVLSLAWRAWRSTDLRLVAASEYDAGSVTVWLSTPDARQGVQIDFTFDRARTNQFDLPMHRWLDAAEPGVAWPTVPHEDEAEYRRRKDAFKTEGWRRPRTWRRTAAEARRAIRRVTRPAGFHVHLRGAEADAVSTVLADRFERLLSRVAMAPDSGPHPLTSWRSVLTLVGAHLRNGLTISTSAGARGVPHPHLVIDTDEHQDPDRCAEVLTEAMAARLERQWSGARPTG